MREYRCNEGPTEIAQFHDPAPGDKDVLGLQVTMEDLLAVNVEQSRGNLDEHVHDFVLTKELLLALHLRCLPILDSSEHIALLTERSYDAQGLLMIYKAFLIADDVGVVECREELSLCLHGCQIDAASH